MTEPGAEPGLNPAAWIDRHGDLLFRYAVSRLRDADAAEEVVQDTFVSALGAAGQYAGTGAEAAWLLGILKRKVIDYVRLRNRTGSDPVSGEADDLTQSLFDVKGNWRSNPRLFGEDPGAMLEREEFWALFRDCLSRLPERLADAFVLREMDDLSTEEICQELGLSPSNVWTMLYRARLRLAACLKFHWES